MGFIVFTRLGAQRQEFTARLMTNWYAQTELQDHPAVNSLSLFSLPAPVQQKADLWIPKEDEPSAIDLSAVQDGSFDTATDNPITDSQR